MGHECYDCTFVVDAKTLLTFLVPREVRNQASKKPLFVGKFTMTGWSGHSGFYLFKCLSCDTICVDYPHGYRENGCLYIRCDMCRFEIVFYPGKDRDVYERENVVAPPTFWEELKYLWKERKQIKGLQKAAAEAEDTHGIKVLINGEDVHDPNIRVRNRWNAGLWLLALWTLGILFLTHPNWRPF